MRKKLKRKILRFAQGNKLREIDQFYYEKFCFNIRNNIPFSFARYGDGEWVAMLQTQGTNCDGHQYFEDMGEQLKAIVSGKVDYYIGIQPMTVRNMLATIGPIAFAHNNCFFNSDLLHNASEFGLLSDFLQALKDKNIILVGPKHLKNQTVLDISHHVIIPDKDCWLQKENTLSEVEQHLAVGNFIVLFCASMAANVYVDELFKKYGDQHSFLDIGSLLDPFGGKISRSYHKKLKMNY